MSTPRDRARAAVRGLYGIADAEASGGDPERLAAALLDGGCRLVQVRCKPWTVDALLEVSRAIVARARAVGAAVVVNDHVDVALAAGADGVHVGQEDLAAEDARRRAGDALFVGVSTNTPDQARAAAPHADYLAFGPVWDTASAGRPKIVRSAAGLAAVRAAVPGLPLVAIGGITGERVPAVRDAGADAWAVIGAVAHAADPVAATRALLGA